MPQDLIDGYSQLWFREWLGAVRQQTITLANDVPDICRHMVSLGHGDLWKLRLLNTCMAA